MPPSRDIEEASNNSSPIQNDDVPTRRSCFSRKMKVMIAVFNVTAVAVILSVFLSRSRTNVPSTSSLNEELSFGINNGDSSLSNESVDNNSNGSSSTSKKEVTDFDAITVHNGPLPGYLSSRNSLLYRVPCKSNEALTQLNLITDGYAGETSWEIVRSDGTNLAFGPPTGSTYERMTSYQGDLCLPIGRNVLIMKDKAGDGICCVYGKGKMTISMNGETLVETGDEDFKTQEYPFELFTNGDIVVDSFTPSTVSATDIVDSFTTSTVPATDISVDVSWTGAFLPPVTTTSSSVVTTSTAVAASTEFESTTTQVPSTTESINGNTDYCITIEVVTDKFSRSETAYAFSSKPKNKNQDPIVYVSKAIGDLQNEKLYSDTFCVPAGTYQLHVEDKFRGLCCSGGQGYYAVFVNGEEILFGGNYASFPGTSVTHDIIVGEDSVSDSAKVWLDAHNSRRESFHVSEGTEYKPLVWSDALENDAKIWLNEILVNCKTVRESGLEEGENLSFRKVGLPRDTEDPENILKRWVDLKKGKSYPENASMTQAMWRATRYLGCANGSKKYADGSICYASLCRYSRAGNCVMGKYKDDWKTPVLLDRTMCGPVCPDDGCH